MQWLTPLGVEGQCRPHRHEFGELPTAITAPVLVVITHTVPAAPLLVTFMCLPSG